MSDRPLAITDCPSCGCDLTSEQSRDRVTLNDVEGQVQDRFRGRIRHANIWQTHLIAWRCNACSAVVPAYDLTSPIMHLRECSWTSPGPSAQRESFYGPVRPLRRKQRGTTHVHDRRGVA